MTTLVLVVRTRALQRCLHTPISFSLSLVNCQRTLQRALTINDNRCPGRGLHVSNLCYSTPLRTFSSISNIKKVDGIPTIEAGDAKKNLKQFDTILDVREADEVVQGAIPSSVHAPLGQVIRDMQQPTIQQMKNQKILVYCRSGKRSALATKILSDGGFNATNLAGGWLAWNNK